MSFAADPWFWALLALLGLQGAGLVVSGHRLGQKPAFVATVLLLFTAGRVLLALPLCPQPRFDLGVGNDLAGAAVLLLAAGIGLPTITIRWWRAPAAGMRLRTRGVYGLVRHPMYLAELLWPVGWSLLWGSAYGLWLTPLWWCGLLLHVLLEEAQLARQLGGEYEAYARRVRGRILPGLPL